MMRITDIHEGLANAEAVRCLDLSGKGLLEVDVSILAFAGLEELVLDGNPGIATLPDELGFLPRLRALSLCRCDYSLVATLGALPFLERLDLSGMDLGTKVGESSRLEGIGTCRLLRELIVRDARLETVPASIAGLSSLERLDLDRNELEELPQDLGLLESLAELSLRDNRLYAIPPRVLALPRLKKLFVAGNRLSRSESAIRALSATRPGFVTDIAPPGSGRQSDDGAAARAVTEAIGRLKIGKTGKTERFIDGESGAHSVPPSFGEFLWGYDWSAAKLSWHPELMEEGDDDTSARVFLGSEYAHGERYPHDGSVYLGIGAYRSASGQPYRLLLRLDDSEPEDPIVYSHDHTAAAFDAMGRLSAFLGMLIKV